MIPIRTFLYPDGDSDRNQEVILQTKREGLLLMCLATRRPSDRGVWKTLESAIP